MKSFFDNICHGTTLSLAQGIYNLKGKKCMDIVCSCGQLNKNAKNVSFMDGMNSKNGVKRETVKKQQSPNQQHIVNVMPRWDKKKHTKKTKQQEKAMKVIDTHEGEKSKTSFKVCCSGGKMTAMEQYCCKFQLKVVMDTITNHWWLMSDSNIEHSNHPLVTKETEGIQF